MTTLTKLQEALSSYYVDRCGNCLEPTDRDFLNQYGECRDCAARSLAEYIEQHPHAKRAEIMAEGYSSGLNDSHINLIMTVHYMNWGDQ